jgi:hypothetical protein
VRISAHPNKSAVGSEAQLRIRARAARPNVWDNRFEKAPVFSNPSSSHCWTKPLRGGKTSAIFILSLWERLPNREKSWQNATHTVSGNEPELKKSDKKIKKQIGKIQDSINKGQK